MYSTPLNGDIITPSNNEITTDSGEPKKKKKFWIILGVIALIGLLTAIILYTKYSRRHSEHGRHKRERNVTNNPFVWVNNHQNDDRTRVIHLFNNRTAIEKDTFIKPNKPIDIKNTTENLEPNYIRVTYKQLDEHLLNVKFDDPEWSRWEVPDYGHDADPYSEVSDVIIPKQFDPVIQYPDHKFEWSFYGKKNKETDPPLITTKDCRLQYFDKYIEFEAKVQTDYIFGMGERVESFLLKSDNYSLWNRDINYDRGDDSVLGTFGSHPFFLNRLKNKKEFIGIYMRNSNAMLFSFWHDKDATFINYKMIGGIIDMYLFHSAEPEYIIRKYHSVIGRPYLVPVWAMGFQQARQGYTLKDLKKVLEGHFQNKIPIDALWADVDLNNNYKTFTADPTRYGGLKEFVQQLHDPKEGIDMKFVAIANPGLKKEPGYKYYDNAIKHGVAIKSALHYSEPFEGRTIAGVTIWLDFFDRTAAIVWAEGIYDLYQASLFDGLWIKENEPNQYCDGECKSKSECKKSKIPDPFHNASEFDYIQYRPTVDPLERTTLPMAAYHCCNDMFYKQYNTHNLFGLQVAKATHESLSGIFEDKRFLIASRSTWPGSGHYSSHWLAENYGSWDSMIASISGVLNFNIFGIPHVGAPIGGFYGNCTGELLIRWYQLASFHPLMLSYSSSNTNPKEAYVDESAKQLIKNAILERYKLLSWMYSQMFESFLWGGSVIQPIFFSFPEDEETYKREVIDRTFMWGNTLYVIPSLIAKQNSVRAYLPNWRWYDLKSFEMVTDYKEGRTGEYMMFDQPLGAITVLIRGGSIFPYQRVATPAKVMNVEDLRKIPATIIVAPDHTGKAQGTFVIDSQGIKPHPDPNSNTYRHYSFTYMNQIFRINKLAGFDFHEQYEQDYFWELVILDVFGRNNIDFAYMIDSKMNKRELLFRRNYPSNSLIITDKNAAKIPMYSLESIVWGSAEQHNLCKFGINVEKVSYADEGKTMISSLVSSEPKEYQLKFDMKASILTDQIISMQIILNDPGHSPWIVPGVVDEKIRKTFKTNKKIDQSGFHISPVGKPFSFELSDPEDSHDIIFTTKNMPFEYVRNFMHLKFMVSSKHVFGLGERVNKFELKDGLYSLWNYDNNVAETGLPPGNNLYGSHLFYLLHLNDPKKWAGVFFLNSNPVDVKIQHIGMQTEIDHMFVGGIIDGFFIQKSSADQVIQNYHYLIGNPVPVPYWAFGYHQSRSGYKDINHLKDVVNKFEENKLPLDGVWLDKDYMQKMRSFTVDKNRWYGLDSFIKELHNKHKHFVPIIDPGIAVDPNFRIYTEGLNNGVFLKGPDGKKPIEGVTWPGYSVWVDFLNPNGDEYWEDCLVQLYTTISFDGLWLDMNQPSNFCDGECSDELHYNYYYFPLDFYNNLYYNPTHRPLEDSTISMQAVHYGGNANNNEFNYHNLFSLYQTNSTAKFFNQKLNKRPLIISSATFPGVGRYASHWLGENYASWRYLEYSIPGIFNFGMFGIPFVGADICGTRGNATIALCSRWMQLGAFYPFMRNHNGAGNLPQEPYIDPKLKSVSDKAIRLRYSLARYIYTQYMQTSLKGGMIFKPVLFDYPDDPLLYSNLDTTFMFGNAIKVTPVLEDHTSTLISYFPNSDWYEFPSLKKVMSYNPNSKEGKNLTLACGLENENINVHLKGGVILPYQSAPLADASITAITKLKSLPISLIVIPDHDEKANGKVFYDEEQSLEKLTYHDYSLTLANSEIIVKLMGGNPQYKYMGLDREISQITVINAKKYKDTLCAKAYNLRGQAIELNIKYEAADEKLVLTAKSGNLDIEDLTKVIWSNSKC